MSKIKSRLIRMVSLWDILIGSIISWFVKKLFDFFWEKGKTQLRFKGKTHIRHRIFVMFGLDFLKVMFHFLLYIPKEEYTSEYRELLTRFLRLHRRYHQLAGNELCCICCNIFTFRSHLEKYVPNSKLYPPFNFQFAE